MEGLQSFQQANFRPGRWIYLGYIVYHFFRLHRSQFQFTQLQRESRASTGLFNLETSLGTRGWGTYFPGAVGSGVVIMILLSGESLTEDAR